VVVSAFFWSHSLNLKKQRQDHGVVREAAPKMVQEKGKKRVEWEARLIYPCVCQSPFDDLQNLEKTRRKQNLNYNDRKNNFF